MLYVIMESMRKSIPKSMRKSIVSDPAILGGMPVIMGTRIPIAQIIFLLKEGYTLEAIHEFYPHVSLKKLAKAVDEAIELITAPNVTQAP